MNLNPVILAIPMFFTLMALELVYESVTNRKSYRLNDTVTNISTGTLQQLTNTFKALIKISLYAILYEFVAVYHLPNNLWSFALAMILWDFCYYWEHRMAHRISLFWGGHSVHHQSEEYNLSVALRQTSTGFIWGFPFFLPMAILGISPEQFVLAGGLNLLYQFWIHTEHINRLPRWFEFVLNTPSHHRVHHGRDPKYLDKNYGGILIIWDRIFGTFKKEEERPHYGVTVPLQSWNPVYANIAHYVWLYGQAKQARTWGDTARILFNPPGWLPDYLGGYPTPKEVDSNYQKYNQSINLKINIYVLVQFFVAMGTNAYYFFLNKTFPTELLLAYGAWIIWTSITFGFLFEHQKRWLNGLELIRLAAIPLGIYWMQQLHLNIPDWSLVLAILFAVISGIVFLYLGRKEQS